MKKLGSFDSHDLCKSGEGSGCLNQQLASRPRERLT